MKLGESGVTYRLNTGFDMSSYTELTIYFVKPNGVVIPKTTADGVVLGSVTVTQEVDGVNQIFTANKYMEYPTEDIFDVEGTWKVYGKYTNTGATPDDIFFGDTDEFQVQTPGKVY